MIGPLVDELADDYSGRIKVGKVNVDDEGRLAEQHGITSVPALFLYNNGAVAGQRIGAALKHEIEALFKNLI
jgi:thioredoxin 1